MILDANLLLYAIDELSPHHVIARDYLEEHLNGPTRIGLPWQTVGAFLRIASHPRVLASPLTADESVVFVQDWLAAPAAWIPPVDDRTWAILSDLTRRHGVTGNLVPDAQLAALAVQYGVPVASADSDFARFPEVRWVNPLVA